MVVKYTPINLRWKHMHKWGFLGFWGLVIIGLTLPNVGMAETYYLDAIDGNDVNPGTSDQPWQTISKAQSVATNGDTVVLCSGPYGDFVENLSNSRTDWITYKAAENNTPIVTNIAVHNTAVQNNYLKFEGITIQIPDTWYTDNGYNTNEPNNWPANPQGGGPFNLTVDCVSIYNANYVYLKNCTIRGIHKHLTCFGVVNQNSHYVTVEHCEITNVAAPLRSRDSHYYTAKYNHLHAYGSGSGIGLVGLLIDEDKILGAVLEYNHIHDQHVNPTGDYYPSNFHGGSAIAIKHSNVATRCNIIHDICGQGIKLYGTAPTSIKPHINMVLENNLVYDCTNYNAFDNLGGVCVIRNNTFIGKVVDDGHAGGNYTNIFQRYGGMPFMVRFASGFDGTGVEIYNNVIVGKWVLPNLHDPNVNKYTGDHNIWWEKGGNNGYYDLEGQNSIVAVWMVWPVLHGFPEYFEDLGAGFTQWTPEFSAGSSPTPFFVNPGFYTHQSEGLDADTGKIWGYHLAEHSSGINFGDPCNQPSDSLGTIGPDGFIRNNGPARDANYHSAGCYEYVPVTIAVPADVNSIQGAIDLASNGFTIVVEQGRYYENINFGGKSLTIMSTDPNDPNIVANTIIDGNETGSVVTFNTSEDANCIMAGFTITCGNATHGGGIYIDSASPIVEKNIIIANNALEGGGIYCRDDSAIIRLNKIVDNEATLESGGAICGVNSSATLANNLIVSNTAVLVSGVAWNEGTPTILNNTITRNSSTADSFSCSITVGSTESPVIRNNIIAFNDKGIEILGGFVPSLFRYNNVFGNTAGDYGEVLTDQTGYNGNISAPPFFFDVNNNDCHLLSQAGRWDPNSRSWVTDANMSLCVDAGDPNDNFTGELWQHGQLINMGAYGRTPKASMSESDAGNIADLNNDGTVDSADIALFVKKWLFNETLLAEDFDRNGSVNLRDFAILGAEYLKD